MYVGSGDIRVWVFVGSEGMRIWVFVGSLGCRGVGVCGKCGCGGVRGGYVSEAVAAATAAESWRPRYVYVSHGGSRSRLLADDNIRSGCKSCPLFGLVLCKGE